MAGSAFERPHLVLRRLDRDYRLGVVPGAILIDADCGHRAWIGPAGIAFQVQNRPRTICDTCLLKRPDAMEAIRGGMTVPGAVDEMVAAGEDETKVRDLLRRIGITPT